MMFFRAGQDRLGQWGGIGNLFTNIHIFFQNYKSFNFSAAGGGLRQAGIPEHCSTRGSHGSHS
jgi:hypothetical protein